MRYLHPVAAVPNSLISDDTLHHSTKRVAVVLLLMAGRKNKSVSATVGQIATEAKCSTATVQQAIRELIEAGYITKERKYRFCAELNRLIYAANSYVWQRREGGYTLVRRDILSYEVTHATFCNLLFLYRCAGQKDRAFPSLRRIAGFFRDAGRSGLDMAKSTVCRALNALHKLQAILRVHYEIRKHFFGANSYFLPDCVQSRKGASFSDRGSPKIDKHNIINQITKDYTNRKEKYGVAQFVDFAKNQPFYYDGTGVLVSVTEEQLELLWA